MATIIWLIGLISLVNDSASEMLYPLIPLYLASVLMAGPKALGIIEGIAEATASLTDTLAPKLLIKGQGIRWELFAQRVHHRFRSRLVAWRGRRRDCA